MVVTPLYNPSLQENLTAYSRKLDSAAFWNRLMEHIFVVAFFAWLSAGFLTRKEFRVDLTETHLMEVFQDLFCRMYLTAIMHAPDPPKRARHAASDVGSLFLDMALGIAVFVV